MLRDFIYWNSLEQMSENRNKNKGGDRIRLKKKYIKLNYWLNGDQIGMKVGDGEKLWDKYVKKSQD